MLKARITVDLPSAETDRKRGPLEWVRSLFGAKLDLRSGKEAITVGAFALVEALAQGFAAAGVDDALSFLVDHHVVYMDDHERANDLAEVARLASVAGVLDKPFTEMHLVLAHRSATIHTLFDCRITREVLVGQAEMDIVISSRLFAMQIRPGESAKEYADRTRAFVASEASFEPARAELDALADRVAVALQRVLLGAKLVVATAIVQVVRPDRAQIGKFATLPFGAGVKPGGYRRVPTRHRTGAYSDPMYTYYYDPYYDYLYYHIVDSMVHHGAWHSPHVHVVDPHGHSLFTGDCAPTSTTDWGGDHAVRFDDAGGLEIDRACQAAAESPTWWESSLSSTSSSSDDASPSAWSDSSSVPDDASRGSSCSSSATESSASSCGSSCSSGSSCGSSCGSSD